MKKVLFFVLMICFAQIEAVLPPLYQTISEYKALLADPQLAQNLDSAEVIQSISLRSEGFLIKTSKRILEVEIVYEPQKMPGPSKFHFVFKKPAEK